MALLIAGFAGIGKTTLSKKYENVKDLDSVFYKYLDVESLSEEEIKNKKNRIINPLWPNNYINAIKESLFVYDVVLILAHVDLFDVYDSAGLSYSICYPDEKAIVFYESRFLNRGNNEEFIRKVLSSYEKTISLFEKRNNKKIVLKGSETLEDYLIASDIL